MARNPVVLIHGYSDEGKSFRVWRNALKQRGYAVEELPVCNYQSLTNEITIKDIAEGFDRALRTHPQIDKDQPFDAIVHSTGMLVLRSWLTTNPIGRKRLKHLIGLASIKSGPKTLLPLKIAPTKPRPLCARGEPKVAGVGYSTGSSSAAASPGI